MLHIVQSAHPPFGCQALRAMFEARKRVFVDLLGWQVPVIDGRYEVDQFDDAHCLYLILTDVAGAHHASARLLPTVRPHILDSLYPDLCAGPPPCGADIYEITRFCLERGLDARDRRRARDTLVLALAEFALAHGITGYTAIAERAWVRQIEAFGWRTRRLGAADRGAPSGLTALAIAIEHDTPARLATAGVHADDALIAQDRRDAA